MNEMSLSPDHDRAPEAEPPSEGAIIDAILKSSEKMTDPSRYLFPQSDWENVLTYGRKRLVVGFSEKIGPAVLTKIDNVLPETEKKNNETTFLYQAARKLIQDFANATGQPVNYRLRTNNPKISEWAKAKGQEIFHWQHQHWSAHGDAGWRIFETNIPPEQPEP